MARFKENMKTLINNTGKLIDKATDAVNDGMEAYDQIMREGDYARQPNIIKRLLGLAQNKKKPKTTLPFFMGQKAVGAGIGLGMKTIVGAMAVVFASKVVAIGVGAGVLVGGVYLLYHDYKTAKNKREDIIEEWNISGQKVRGARGDLCRLRAAHMKLLYPELYTPEGSMEPPDLRRDAILATVEAERARVEVLEVRNPDVSADGYCLSGMKIEEHDAAPVVPEEGTSKLGALDLRAEWRSHVAVSAAINGRQLVNPVPVHIVAPVPVKNSLSTVSL